MFVGIQLLCSPVITFLHFALGVLVLLRTEATLRLLLIKQMGYHTSVLPNTREHLWSVNSMSCAIPVSKHIKKMCHIREDRSKQQAQLGPNTNKMEAMNKWKISFLHFVLHTKYTVNKLRILNMRWSLHTSSLCKLPFQEYLTVTWDIKSDFGGVTICIYIKNIHPHQQSTHRGRFLYEQASFHHEVETFSHWANLKQWFVSTELHLSQWHMHSILIGT